MNIKFYLLSCILLFSTISYSQTNTELKNDIEQIKKEITTLRSEINSVKSQNIYLKNTFDITTPILELSNDDNTYKLTKIIGNKKDKTITINFLIESKNANKNTNFNDFFLIDLLGNQYKIDFTKSSSPFTELTLNVPIAMKIQFKDIIDEPEIIKLFKFRVDNKLETDFINKTRSYLEFKDINVKWE